MNVVLLSFGTKGGAGQYPAEIANGISEQVECHSLVPSTHSELGLYNNSVDVLQLDTEKKLTKTRFAKYPLIVKDIHQKISEIDPDIVHLPFYSRYPSVISLGIIKLLRKPVVGTIHDPRTHGGDEIGPLNFDLQAHLKKISAHYLDRVIVHGAQTRKQAVSLGYPEKTLRVIPHGMYDQFGQNEGKEPEGNHTILFFGHLTKYRGTDRLTTIADQLSEYCDNFQILVAGSMSEKRRQSEWGKQVLQDMKSHPNIVVRDDYIPESEVEDLFNRASIVVLPYYDATTSGVVMTAYSFATPIVATDTGDMGWTIRKDETGLLASPDSTTEVTDKIMKVLSDESLRDQIQQNIIKEREKYSWHRIGKQTVDVYREIVGNS